MSCDGINPVRIVRIGKAGRHPRQILIVLRSGDECERILKKCRDGPKLRDDVFIMRDRTFKQRQEAKLFRIEKEKEEKNGEQPQPGSVRGGRGRGRPRGRGGRGGRGGRFPDSASRKRRNSDDTENSNDVDESKRQRTGGGGGTTARGGASATATTDRTPENSRTTKPSSDHIPTPGPLPATELGAVGGEGVGRESF